MFDCDSLNETKSSQLRLIVFVRTRHGVKQTLRLLQGKHAHSGSDRLAALRRVLNRIRPRGLAGKGTRDVTESIASQRETVRLFREGVCNVLVATSVAEEGLDFPECNAVIRMEGADSDVALAQSAGRVRSDGEFVVIFRAGTAEEARLRRAEETLETTERALARLPSRCHTRYGGGGEVGGEGINCLLTPSDSCSETPAKDSGGIFQGGVGLSPSPSDRSSTDTPVTVKGYKGGKYDGITVSSSGSSSQGFGDFDGSKSPLTQPNPCHGEQPIDCCGDKEHFASECCDGKISECGSPLAVCAKCSASRGESAIKYSQYRQNGGLGAVKNDCCGGKGSGFSFAEPDSCGETPVNGCGAGQALAGGAAGFEPDGGTCSGSSFGSEGNLFTYPTCSHGKAATKGSGGEKQNGAFHDERKSGGRSGQEGEGSGGSIAQPSYCSGKAVKCDGEPSFEGGGKMENTSCGESTSNCSGGEEYRSNFPRSNCKLLCDIQPTASGLFCAPTASEDAAQDSKTEAVTSSRPSVQRQPSLSAAECIPDTEAVPSENSGPTAPVQQSENKAPVRALNQSPQEAGMNGVIGVSNSAEKAKPAPPELQMGDLSADTQLASIASPEVLLPMAGPVESWGVDGVCTLFATCGFGRYEGVLREMGVDGKTLLTLTDEDLLLSPDEGGLGMPRLQIRRLRAELASATAARLV